MSGAPTVFCPKEGKKVPIWFCVGSWMQRKRACPHCIEAKINFAEDKAEVKCAWKAAKVKKQ